MLSTESNNACESSAKKTISPEHVTQALKVSPVLAIIHTSTQRNYIPQSIPVLSYSEKEVLKESSN